MYLSHLVLCKCGCEDPPDPCGKIPWIQCELCEVWVHGDCYNLKSEPETFKCLDCDETTICGMKLTWTQCLSLGVCVCYTHPYMSLQRKLVKNLMDPTFEKGSSGQFQEWSAARGIPIHTLGRNIGDRFFGTFFLQVHSW